MGSSLPFLTRHFMQHPEHRFLLLNKLDNYPKLLEQFENISDSKEETAWMSCLEQLERTAPTLVAAVLQELSSLLYGSAPNLDAFSQDAPIDPTVAEGSQHFIALEEVSYSLPPNLPRASRIDLKRLAIYNSKRVYMVEPGWHEFQMNIATGEVLPSDIHESEARRLHCKLERASDESQKNLMAELHLYLSEHRILSFKEQKWFWKNTRKTDRTIKMDIKDIPRVLPADVVDLLLDLVSPGLFFQGADAHQSNSFSQSNRDDNNASPSNPQTKPSPASHPVLEIGEEALPEPSYSSAGERFRRIKTPFATHSLIEELGETTAVRRAWLQPNQSNEYPTPRKLQVSLVQNPSFWARLIGRRAPIHKTLCELTINESKTLDDYGLQFTFLLESTGDHMFPWVSVCRDAIQHQESVVTLIWNQDQTQLLPPDFKSTGALSRHASLGTLDICFHKRNQLQHKLHIQWLP